MLGFTPPPIGWVCSLTVEQFGDLYFPTAYCEPDPLLVEQQEREKQEWLTLFIQRALENRERVLRRR